MRIVLTPAMVVALGAGCGDGPRGPLSVPAQQRATAPTGKPLGRIGDEWVEVELIPPTNVPVPKPDGTWPKD